MLGSSPRRHGRHEGIFDAGSSAHAPGPRVCRSGRTWSPGMPAFEDHTADWGLASLNGTNFGVADLDNDGWPDLVLNHGSPYDRTSGQVFMNRAGDSRRRFEDNTMAS